jgi:Protein of unknown function (DUF964).
MDSTEKIAKEINKILLDSSQIKLFKIYEKKVKELSELQEVEKEVKELQKNIVIAKLKNDSFLNGLELAYQEKKAYLENHPLIVNYLNEKEDLNNYLQEIILFIQKNLEIS